MPNGEMPVVSVTELVSALKEVVETALPPCVVEAEISNCRRSPAGHYYLTLKDENSEIGACIWRSTASRIRFDLKDGLNVLATGSLQVYVARGTCQFIINQVLPQGVGALELAFRQLQEKLAAEGLFDEDRKRPLPAIPRRIALVTSPSSAAVKDMIQVMTRRWPAVNLVIVPVRVQGEGAAEEIADALRHVHQIPGVDVVICGRGGGSLEDLWCFNEEIVARAIADCRIPVVSAVGHEIDVSIADLVADRRALTPSEAGELVVPSQSDVRMTLDQSAARMQQSLNNRIQNLRLQVAAVEARAVFQHPMSMVDEWRQSCDELHDRCVTAMNLFVERRQQLLAQSAASLSSLSPLTVLARGYSLTTLPSGQLVRSVLDVTEGTVLRTRVADGTLTQVVQTVAAEEPADDF